MSINKYRHSQKTNGSSKKPLIIAVIAVLLLVAAAGGVYYKVYRNSTPDSGVTATTEPKLQDKVDLSPPSAEEEKSGDDIKEEIIKQQEQQQPPRTENNKKAVTPVIVSAYISGGTVSVRGFISGTIETNGTCSFVFSKNGQTVTKTSTVVANASTTDCKPVNFSANELPSGTSGWKVKLQYSSSASEGTSTDQDVMVN